MSVWSLAGTVIVWYIQSSSGFWSCGPTPIRHARIPIRRLLMNQPGTRVSELPTAERESCSPPHELAGKKTETIDRLESMTATMKKKSAPFESTDVVTVTELIIGMWISSWEHKSQTEKERQINFLINAGIGKHAHVSLSFSLTWMAY